MSRPDITVEPSDAAACPSQARGGDTIVAIAAGEAMAERHALEALLPPSTDNTTGLLARDRDDPGPRLSVKLAYWRTPADVRIH